MKHSVAVAALGAVLAACAGAEQPGALEEKSNPRADVDVIPNAPAALPPAAVASKQLTLRDLGAIAGVDCKNVEKGLECSTGNYENGDYYDVDLSLGCGKGGLFAGVANKAGTQLLDRAPPKDTMSVATLADGQLVCIQATAHIKGESHWYYVTAVPADSLDGCAGTSLCERYGDREVKWHAERPSPMCQSDGPWQFSGSCATGWADADDFDVFSNGLDFAQ